jgi:predicted RNase H-like nuclease (RuvC/YqgF family)
VEEYKASGNNKDKDTEIQKLKDSNEKLQKEGQAARAENYTLKQRLGSDEHRKSNLFTFQNQLDQSRQDGADKLTRLSQEKDAVIRDLKAKLEASGGGAEIQQIKSLAERNKTLTKQVEELAGLKTPGIYEALLAVAKMMGEVSLFICTKSANLITQTPYR